MQVADQRIHTAPPDSGTATLGLTLTELLYRSAETWGDGMTLTQRRGGSWVPVGLNRFLEQAELLALGLLDLGLVRGDRVALYMESDVDFCLVDAACLIAGLVDVPIYLTHDGDGVDFVLDHSGARALFVSNARDVVRMKRHSEKMHVLSVEDFGGLERRALERWPDAAIRRGMIDQLRTEIAPSDLSTIIYTSGTTGVPKGVMLSHENISFNAVTSFSGMRGYLRGPGGEVGLSFLPLTHVFARALYYGFIEAGTPITFSTPDDVGNDLRELHPTVFAAVPRVIEKVYARFLERGAVLSLPRRKIFEWSLRIARRHTIGRQPTGRLRVEMALADRLVYSKWREGLGGSVRYIISGGAALSAELATIFDAASIQILQGYGLTETSPVISFNRPDRNRAGTVGHPIPGVEVMIAADGEILTRGPHVMLGYYRAPDKTREVIDQDGWFHTGDIGEFDEDGFLRITDRKKDLFKLSTGKYVMPQPIEHRLGAEALIDQAVVTGAGRKYCTALIFPSESALRTLAGTFGLATDKPLHDYFDDPRVVKRFGELVEKANAGMDSWSTVKRFRLIAEPLTVESGLLTPTMKVKRRLLSEKYAEDIDTMYSVGDRSTIASED